jgi:uncharacterized membrane protein
MKTIVMLIGLAAAFAAITACFGMFSKSPPPAETQVEACAGLSGQAKIDCEQRQGR